MTLGVSGLRPTAGVRDLHHRSFMRLTLWKHGLHAWLGIAWVALTLAHSPPAAEPAATPPGEISGAPYDWTKTRQPERPYLHPYHQTLVMKLFLAWKLDNDTRGPNRVIDGSNVYLTFEQALEVIRKLDALTLGIPKIVYLVGWQHNGHDSKYPDWSVVNPRLKRAADATAADSLRWLMAEGFKHHTTVSLHVNMFDAYRDSPLWETYLAQDIIAKDSEGRPLLGEQADLPGARPRPETQVHYLSYAREWETGYAQRRIDGLLRLLPVERAGTLHIDAFHSLRPIPHAYPQDKFPDQPKSDTRISPYLNYPLEKEVAAQRRIFRYFRDHGVDVTSEGSTFLRPDAFVGLQPMAWDYQPPAPGIPPELYCGTPMRAEPEILRDPETLTGLLAQFCERVVPWYYSNNTASAKGPAPRRDGTDLCFPALWREQTLVAFSRDACTAKRWELPPGWEGVRRVNVAEITVEGPRPRAELEIVDGGFSLTLAAGQGVVITARALPDLPDERSAAPPTAPDAPTSVNFQEALPAVFTPRLLPGHREFAFTLYGVPGDLPTLKQVVEVMRARTLGNGFDPGPTPTAESQPIFDYLASIGWPVVAYPGCADMQIKGGRCVLGPANAQALAAMDRAGLFTAVQLGEWGYYFHNLSLNEPWWRDVFGPDFERFKHLMKPKGLAGYDQRPTSRRECYEVLKDYFTSRRRDLLDRVISVTGHSHYEAYAGEWGARCIGLEVAENIAFTQSKFAFARGASRQWSVPWSVQVSPWFSGACTTSGPLLAQPGGARGLDAGHSLSLYERLWLHAWFAGAAMVTPENSYAIFFEKTAPPWALNEHGRRAAEVFAFMRAHDRGTPYTPVAVVLDHLAGYNGYMDKPWGILEPTPGDRETRDLFDFQLFPGSDHIHHRPDPTNPEAGYLRPTPYGELFDVQLSRASGDLLARYPVLLLVGDHTFEENFVAKLEQALRTGRHVLISAAHRAALGGRFARLAAQGPLEVLAPWKNPATGRSTAIGHARLQQLADELSPVEVTGDSVQYQGNRTAQGWVIELVNNTGVAKTPNQPATLDAAAVARVRLHPRFAFTSAVEWRSGQVLARSAAGDVAVEIGPGRTVFVELR